MDLNKLVKFYRKHLFVDIMPFWERRTLDNKFGGYITCFDREGNVFDLDKYIWFQGRQLWTFSTLFNNFGEDPKWLAYAKHGRDFIINHAYGGDGRWFYHLDRRGTVIEKTISIFTDLFVLSGLVEYAIATGSDEDRKIITDTYNAIERNVNDPNFSDIYHIKYDPRYKRHALQMITLNVASCVERFFGDNRTKLLSDSCLENILYKFANDEHQALFETISKDDNYINNPEGNVINPGHGLESMWFCYEEGKKRKDQVILDRVGTIVNWIYEKGYDHQDGGVYAFVSLTDEKLATDWHKETGMKWSDKSFWANAEALYTFALMAVEKNDQDSIDRFINHQKWCLNNFYDSKFGEWYAELVKDGTPKLTDKGTKWKAAYHVPRALLKCLLLFENNIPNTRIGKE